MAGRVLKPRSNSKKSSLTGLLKKLAFAGLLPAVLRAQNDEFKITDGAEVTDLDTVEGSEIIEYLKNVSADQGKYKIVYLELRTRACLSGQRTSQRSLHRC